MSTEKSGSRASADGSLKYDPVEVAAVFCEGINRGKTAATIAKNIIEFGADRCGAKRTRRVRIEMEREASNLVTAFKRARDALLQPWEPEIGKGIHRFETSPRVSGFGELMFMGRPLPRPIGIEPRVSPKPGRPKKSKT